MRNTLTLAFLAAIPFLAACGQAGFEEVGKDKQAILYGTLSGPADDGVMMIWASSSTQIQKCTASLVAPNLVVTALHCVSNFDESQAYSCDASGNVSAGKGGVLGTTLDPSTLSIHVGTGPDLTLVAKGQQVFATQTTTICHNDIALVLLDRAVDAPIVPLRLLTGTSVGEKVRMVGYGLDENGNLAVRRVRDDLAIAQVGTSPFNPNGDPIPPRALVTDGPAGCDGDSGGPIFSKYKAVVGTYSSVSPSCSSSEARDLFTEVAPFYQDLVVPAFQAANAEPVFENMTDAAGAGGEGNTAGADSGGSAGDTPTAVGGGDTAGSAPTGSAGGTAYTGLRKAGGCTCRAAVPSSDASFEPLLALPLLLLLRRRRAARRR
jgi:Trypsin